MHGLAVRPLPLHLSAARSSGVLASRGLRHRFYVEGAAFYEILKDFVRCRVDESNTRRFWVSEVQEPVPSREV
jgi:hypothetical protein